MGALLSKPALYSYRVWDQKKADTLDLGTTLTQFLVAEIRGFTILRISPSFSGSFSRWIVDQARFGYDFVEHNRAQNIPHVTNQTMFKTFSRIKEIYVQFFSTIHFLSGRSMDLNLSYAIKQLSQNLSGSFFYIPYSTSLNQDFMGSFNSFDLFSTTILLGVNLRYDNPLYAVSIKQNKSNIINPASLESFFQGKELIWKVLTASSNSSFLVIHANSLLFSFSKVCQLFYEGVYQQVPVILPGTPSALFEGLLLNYFKFKQNIVYFSLEAESLLFNQSNIIYLGSHNTERQTDIQIACAHILERKNANILGQDGLTFKNTFLFLSPSHSRDPITTLRLMISFLLKRVIKTKNSKLWRNKLNVNYSITTFLDHINEYQRIPHYKYRTLQERSSLCLALQFTSFKLF